jgi:hypothetical protein
MRRISCARKKPIVLVVVAVLIAVTILEMPVSPVVAQETTTVWEGRLISDISDLNVGGTILRVSVKGRVDLPIEVSSAHGGWTTTLLSGSKSELGPYAAEFAGLSAGQYIITPQGLGATLTVEADGTDIIVVEFVQVTKQVGPAPPPPQPPQWTAKIVAETANRDLGGSVLRVSVVGETGLPVEVASEGNWNTIGYTGTKPEYGDYVAEFAALQPGNYVIRPQGVDTEFWLWLSGKTFVFVEFRRTEGYKPAPAPSPTTAPAIPAATVTSAATGSPPAAPAPAGTPYTVWTGEVVSNTSSEADGGYLSSIQVIVEGMKGLPVEVKAGGWSATAQTGTKPECGAFCLEFGGLAPSLYTITPQGLGTSAEVTVEGGGVALVKFTSKVVAPPAPTATPGGAVSSPTKVVVSPTAPTAPTATAVPRMVWAARTLWNTSSPGITGAFHSAIEVTVQGLKGLPVEIKSGGWSASALTGSKTSCGDFCLEFGGLSGSKYTLIPQGLGIEHVVEVDGEGFAVVEFYQRPAQPKPEVWAGRVKENVAGGGKRGYFSAIQVVVEGKKWLPVELKAGGWSATELTGTKPACGGYCLEFGGLAPGTYVVTPQGLGVSVTVTVDEGGFAVVEFYLT